MSESLLVSAKAVSTHFSRRSLLDRTPAVQAVNDVSLAMQFGERLALVGESGSGKTTLARSMLGLTPATHGSITVDGIDVRHLTGDSRRRLRRTAQFVHQDPQGSLSPRSKVSSLLTEPYRIHRIPRTERWSAGELLEMVGLNPEQADKYPHELSGGQARRVGIARALALRPKLLVADEPTAGLDVSAAGDILNLIKNVSTESGIGSMIVTHNLNTVAFAADTIAVMYLGSIVELGPVGDVLHHPAHPYTRALIDAVPEADPTRVRDQPLLGGEIPSARTPPPGCRFHTRCPLVFDRCRTKTPELLPVAEVRRSACHLSSQVLDATKEEPTT
ncbi:ABC transporter ATP-binding protein [Nocardioidaceae bacterium SCSIO 66511]|nr:ABC transporter ATP-binding protein [Nocardioidaceae bacterium SCSIO 66511]